MSIKIKNISKSEVLTLKEHGTEYLLHEGESIVMPAGHPHAVYGQEAFKMLLVVVF